jgi:hypothetical protein
MSLLSNDISIRSRGSTARYMHSNGARNVKTISNNYGLQHKELCKQERTNTWVGTKTESSQAEHQAD